MQKQVTEGILTDIAAVSKRTIQNWKRQGKISPNKEGLYDLCELRFLPVVSQMFEPPKESFVQATPVRDYKTIDLFAGAGGLSLGLENAGFSPLILNDYDKNACATLRKNRPLWNVVEKDIRELSLAAYKNVDLLTGGFPCQSFSYIGKGNGFVDTRGNLFFDLLRIVSEVQPRVLMLENVKALLKHDNGRSLETIRRAISDAGYTIIEPKIMRAIFYKVPQKRERLIFVCIRNELSKHADFHWPVINSKIYTVRDALKKGSLYDSDCPSSECVRYSANKGKVLALVPQGGDWRDIPESIAMTYLKSSYNNKGGGNTGIARRLSYDRPCLTLTCSPSQKQTERCHPTETRPLSVREYARIQTFPDSWSFEGSLSSKYRQIGNAVPVNMAYALGKSLIYLLNSLEPKTNKV